jgi:hypothetical protein
MMNFPKRVIAMLCPLLIVLSAGYAQQQQVDLFKMQDSANKAQPVSTKGEPVVNTFYSTRLVNSQTVEILSPGSMDFRINHRFAPVNTGIYNMFGLDIATMRLGFDFGIVKDLMIGIGRSTTNKEYDGYIKYRIMHQKEGGVPLSISLLGAMAYRTIDMDSSLKVTGADRTYLNAAVLIASKLNSRTSVQISPTYTRYNRIMNFTGGDFDMFSIGFLARQRISRRVSINAEYFVQLTKFDNTYNSLSFGVDINTGGHVFQLHLTNATGMNEHTFIHETTGSWGKGDIRFGFNISRIFKIGKQAKQVY